MRLKAYAKINLTLDVTGRREDGFHLLDSVMQSVSLCDKVEVRLTATPGVHARCNKPYIPTDSRNSAVAAAQRVLQALGREEQGVFIGLRKAIPSRAGLGSGSADAAAVLFGLNRLLGEALSEETLLGLAAETGADVPFCLLGGTRRCEGIGERLSDAPALPGCSVVLCKPPVGVSTPRAYARLDALPPARTRATPRMLEALTAGDLTAVGKRLYNRFDEALKLLRVREIKTEMLSMGAKGALMTGSGSAVFGLFSDRERAQACLRRLSKRGEVFFAHPVAHGVEIEEE